MPTQPSQSWAFSLLWNRSIALVSWVGDPKEGLSQPLAQGLKRATANTLTPRALFLWDIHPMHPPHAFCVSSLTMIVGLSNLWLAGLHPSFSNHRQGQVNPFPTSWQNLQLQWLCVAAGIPLFTSLSYRVGDAADALGFICLQGLLAKMDERQVRWARCSCALCPAFHGLFQSESPWSCSGRGSIKRCCVSVFQPRMQAPLSASVPCPLCTCSDNSTQVPLRAFAHSAAVLWKI